METYVDDERRRDTKYIVASLRVAAAAGHLLRRAYSTYLEYAIGRRSLHMACGRSQRRSQDLLR